MKYFLLILCLIGLSGCSSIKINPDFFRVKSLREPEQKCNGKCGYVTTRSYDEMAEFFDTCNQEKSSEKTCTANFVNMMFARLKFTYPEANFAKADLWCQAEPKKCTFLDVHSANEYEDQLITSQNDHDQKIQDEKESVRSTENRLRWANAMKAFSDGMNRSRPVNCTTTQYGPTSYTNCR